MKTQNYCSKSRKKVSFFYNNLSFPNCHSVHFLFNGTCPLAWGYSQVKADTHRYPGFHLTQCAGHKHLILNPLLTCIQAHPGVEGHSGSWKWMGNQAAETLPWDVLVVRLCVNVGFTYPRHVSLSHQTSHTKEKFKVKIIKNFKMVTIEH